MELRSYVWTVLFATIGFHHGCIVHGSQTRSKQLFDNLTTDYDSSLLPICEDNGNVTMDIDVALAQILELDERNEIITTSMWIRTSWNDCRLKWTPADYNNLTYITVAASDLWIPDVTLYESATEVMFPGKGAYRPVIYPNGKVYYNFPALITSTCKVNVRFFPFDTQICQFTFGSWSYHGLVLDVIYRNPTGDLTKNSPSAEWIVDSINAVRHEVFYGCCIEPYPDVTYYLNIRRRPTFAVLTMIFPCILTSFMAALGFLLPVESGEKVSLEITVLLSLAVFLLIVSETLPPASDNFPIIGAYFASSMALVSLSLTQTVFVLNIYYRGYNGRRPSSCTRRFFFRFLSKVLCVRTSSENAVEPMKADCTEVVNNEYRDIANILDRFFLAFYVLSSVVTLAALLLTCAVQYGKSQS